VLRCLRKIDAGLSVGNIQLRTNERDSMRRLPKTVKIGGHVISISQKTELDCMGMYDREKAQITLEKTLSQDQKAATLLHEVLHAILQEAHPKLEDRKEEALVTVLETGLFAFIKDNPKVIRYLENT
jgi:Zn-dependent peptidase ImmA (M78 family)